jgi:hypothetical protein
VTTDLAALLARVKAQLGVADDALAAPGADEEAGPRQKCSYDLPVDLAHAFRAVCAIQGVKQRRVIERLVAAYVARHAARRVA